MYIVFAFLASVFACDFKHGEHQYNLTALHRPEGYTVKASADSSFFKMAYQFNFCDKHPSHCQNTPAAYEMIEVLGIFTDSCEMIGKPDDQTVQTIENGLQITYSSGSSCGTNMKRSVNYKVMCSTQADNNFKLDSQDQCTMNFSIKSPAGCPIKIDNYQYFLYLIIAGAIIVTLGIVFGYLKTRKGKENPNDYEKLAENVEQPPKDEVKEVVAEDVPIQIPEQEVVV